ncbi:Adenylate cyclase 1 [Planctomycetes bacterium Pan216]|uniref:Adenylate cyclase 1 n=1 Tax=Kolteria novifilia TaxID=2527975 RepID=A0A518B3J7_9BACT|nr:Adenylate cyclase 1 [Planctomycetes bacterium Pan216]
MLRFRIVSERQRHEFTHPEGPIEFGRAPVSGETARSIVDDRFVSKDHLRVEEIADGRVRAKNLSGQNRVRIDEGQEIPPGESAELDLPVRLVIGQTMLDVSVAEPLPNAVASAESTDLPPEESVPQTAASPPALEGDVGLATVMRPARLRYESDEATDTLVSVSEGVLPETLVGWIEKLVTVQRAAAGSPEFYDETARALVDLIGLDRGLVLLRREDNWEVVARHQRGSRVRYDFSSTIVERVAEEKRTFYQTYENASSVMSLVDIDTVVASPIFQCDDQVVGVLYGSRSRRSIVGEGTIGPLEAQIVQLLAASAGTGLARAQREEETLRVRHQFQQFFSPHVVAELERNPTLLEGQDREVTVMFLDMRGSSKLSQRLNPQEISQLTEDFMEELTLHVRAQEGVVVSYVGDGALAMWNAPTDQPDHSLRACRAALEFECSLRALNERWEPVVGEPIAFGIGVHTGPALVGNTGSRTNLQYGPQGATVNLASRVEGATKHLGAPVLITDATRSRLNDELAVRRICQVEVVGMEGAVALYELGGLEPDAEWLGLREPYERALDAYERADWESAVEILCSVVSTPAGKRDAPSLALLSEALDCLHRRPADFSPVRQLRSK